MTIIAIVNNMSPLIAVVLAFLILKETLKCFEIVMLIMTLGGIMVVIIAGHETSELKVLPTWGMVIVFAGLAINPFLTAGGTIVMRKMKKFHEAVVSWYLNWSILLTSTIVILSAQESFNFMMEWDWESWLFSAGTGLFAVASQTSRFKALKL